MYSLSVKYLVPDMILYEDLYTDTNQLLLHANTVLTNEGIELIKNNNIPTVNLADLTELSISRYERMRFSKHFQNFSSKYNDCNSRFVRMIKNIDTGLAFRPATFINLRNEMLSCVHSVDQLLDYLFFLMPSPTEITFSHCFHCGLIAYVFGYWCNYQPEELDTLTLAGFLYDIGKVRMPEQLVWKNGLYTASEILEMHSHVQVSYNMLVNKKCPVRILNLIKMHHERWDGSGYPNQLSQNSIDQFALLLGMVDTYESLTHVRMHRPSYTPFKAMDIIYDLGNDKFGPLYPDLILNHIANIHLLRNVSLSSGEKGKIIELHSEKPSRPTILTKSGKIDLRDYPEIYISQMD